MNKLEFISVLTDELRKNKIDEIDDILGDFEEHFACKLEEGYSEEEIVRKIGNPIDLVADYAKIEQPSKSVGNILKTIGLIVLDLFAIPMGITLWIAVLILPILAIASLTLGISLIADYSAFGLIPSMPYVSSLILGLSMIGLSVMSMVGSIRVYQYVRQWTRIYFRWHKNTLRQTYQPSMSIHPKIDKLLESKLKLILMISTLFFLSTFILGYIVSSMLAGTPEFWHAWGWFV